MGTHLQVFGSTLGLVRGGGEREGGTEGGRKVGGVGLFFIDSLG